MWERNELGASCCSGADDWGACGDASWDADPPGNNTSLGFFSPAAQAGPPTSAPPMKSSKNAAKPCRRPSPPFIKTPRIGHTIKRVPLPGPRVPKSRGHRHQYVCRSRCRSWFGFACFVFFFFLWFCVVLLL